MRDYDVKWIIALSFITLALLSNNAAFACRGVPNWSTGRDLSRLRSAEIVVQAKILDSFKSEQRYESAITGHEFGMVYYVQLESIVGGVVDENLKTDRRLLIRLPPSICGAYQPRDNEVRSGQALTLVLKKMPDNVYDLVGGQE